MNALQQFLQSASNEAAGTISGPVDLIGMGLRKLGVPVPRNALMSSDWMRQNGLMQDVPQNAASLAGQTFGLLSPAVVAANSAKLARGLLQMGENAAAPKNVSRGASAGQRGIFMGDLSKTWDKSAAAKALEMEKAGADPRAIWQETGTFKGVDGNWRQEIDDSGSMFRGFGATDSQPVGQAIHHPKAIAAYPDLADVRAQSVPGTGGSFSGEMGYAPSSPTINLGWDNGPGTQSVALHEMQHAVQGRQGFATGGSPDTSLGAGLTQENTMDWARKAYEKSHASSGDPLLEELFGGAKKWDQLTPRERLGWIDQARKDAYQSLAGEAEARAVQKRMNMNPLQRRETFPLDSYDVPINELIVRR